MNKDSALPFGIYETPVTSRISERIQQTQAINPTSAFGIASSSDPQAQGRFSSAFAHHVSSVIEARLSELNNQEDRIAFINGLSQLLGKGEEVSSEELLYAVYNNSLSEPPQLPEVSLNKSALFTNSLGDANLSSEIAREIKTADSVDLLCAFVKSSGIAVLDEQLSYLRDNNIPLRVITSTYCGATDAAAVKRLVEHYGAEVRVCYEHQTTRLHAKAWLFRRDSGFDTAFIGSSNLSRSALVDGWEWNVRGSTASTPEVISKFIKTFDSYWHDNHFQNFNPDADFFRLKTALGAAKGVHDEKLQNVELSGLRVEPYPYQQEMLEALRSERDVKDRHRNLLVAATGTGKTVVAALDYRGIAEDQGRRPKLLFVAHRKEILVQALRTYREVLQDSGFGELLVDGHVPSEWNHVFASVQSLNTARLNALAEDHFEVVVIDEFHHAEARTYKQILTHFTPTELLGLTATPERGDGENIEKFFDFRVAHELRLWDALRLQLLAPLHYYGIADGTDLTSLTWNRNKKDYNVSELNELYLKAGEKRTRFIINELQKRIFDLSTMKALGFCVSIAHAEYMADQFNKFGIPALAVSSALSSADRKTAIDSLHEGKTKVLFSVDIFNEGVDIPSVNTLLLLRPTQSPVLFVQQLGRGLRLHRSKEVCNVFDFIGQQHKEFNFEERFKSLTPKRGKHLIHEIEQGFPTTAPGSHISLDRETTEQVLANVKRIARNSSKKILSLVSELKTTNLREFLDDSGVPIEDIYRRKGKTWTTYLREAGLKDGESSQQEEFLLGRLRSMLHINDSIRAQAYLHLLCPEGPSEAELSATEQKYAQMLVLSFWANSGTKVPESLDEALKALRRCPVVKDELEQIMEYRLDQSRVIPQADQDGVLQTHADYSLSELIDALDQGPLSRLASLPREGVKYFDYINTDLFLVTFQKDENVSASTNYRDYPISPVLMHWESQSTTTLNSKAARRYIHHQETGGSVIIATRFSKQNAVGTASAYTFLGNVDYVSHKSEKPIQFEWALRREMPKQLFVAGRTVA